MKQTILVLALLVPLVGCSDVKFDSSNDIVSAKALASNATDSGGAVVSEGEVEIPTVNVRSCNWHETDDDTPIYAVNSKNHASDLYVAMLNLPKDRSPYNVRDAELAQALLKQLPSSKFQNGMMRFALLEQEYPAFAVNKAAYDALIKAAQDSQMTSTKLKTVLLVFDDANHNGKFDSKTDAIVSSSVGVPVSSQTNRKTGFTSQAVASSSGASQLNFQLRTMLLNAGLEGVDGDDQDCALIEDAEMRQLCEQSCDEVEDPLVLDLGGQGFEFTSAEDGVEFDLNVTGHKQKTAWLASKQNYFLALDRNGNGEIDNGSELFGTSNVIRGSMLAANGFEALAELDETGDGVIDSRDASFSRLVLFNDANHDGMSSPDELIPLSSVVRSISLKYTVVSEADQHDNRIYARSVATLINGELRGLVDVFFQQK